MDEREEDRRNGLPDRRERESAKPSAWSDPRTWMTLCGLLLSVCVIIGSFISKQLSDLHADLQKLNDTQIRTFTEQGKDIGYLKDFQKATRDDLRDQNAYNLNMSRFGTEIVTILRQRGIQAPDVPTPPKLGGQ